MKKITWIFATALGLASFASFADYSTAKKYLEEKKWDKAASELMPLAQNGSPKAMYQLARLYENGQGVEENIYQAFAWYSIAADFGHSNAKSKYRELRRAVPSRKEGKLHYKSLAKKYGYKQYQQKFAPEKSESNASARYISAINNPEPNYSSNIKALQSAWVTVGFDVNQQGDVVSPRIVAEFPKDTIDKAALAAIKQWKFNVPKDYSGAPKAVYDLTHTFKVEAAKSSHHRDYKNALKEYNQKLKTLAEKGNAYAQMRYALMLEHDLATDGEHSELDWYYKAAQNGNKDAQLWLVRCLEYGSPCKADEDKAFRWLQLASENGNARAQYQLAQKMLDYNTVHFDEKRAAQILKKATHEQYLPAMISYAKVLAFSDRKDIRNYQEAVKYAELARAQAPTNPVLLSVLGVAYTELGRTEQGQSYLQQAYDEAKRRNWPTQNYLELMEGSPSMMANGTSLIY